MTETSTGRTSPSTVLGAILAKCAEEAGGVRPLARLIGVSHLTVYRLMAATHQPGRHVRRALAAYLNVSPAEVAEWALTAEALQVER